MKDTKKITRKTAKRKVPIVLPDVMSKIYQPNRITQAHLPLTLMQSKIFAYIMLQLQEPIQAHMNGATINQLDLFAKDDCIKIPIHIKDLNVDASNYRHVKQAIRDLASVVVAVPYRNAEGIGHERITGLIRADIPIQATGSSKVIIEIEKKVAEVLINIDKNTENKPINFTSYFFEIVAGSKSQYTGRLYPLIASWRKKGAFSISMDDLKTLLSIENKYDRFFDFKKKVLDPVQQDLYEKSDCWFNCNTKGFKTVEKGKIILNFKVITPEFKSERDKQCESTLYMLKNYHLNEDQLNEIRSILFNYELDLNLFRKRVIEIDDFIANNNQNQEKSRIENKASYMHKALIKQFGNFKTSVN